MYLIKCLHHIEINVQVLWSQLREGVSGEYFELQYIVVYVYYKKQLLQLYIALDKLIV